MMKIGRWAREGALPCVVAIALGMPLSVHGALIYNNGLPDHVSGDNMTEFQVAEDFAITAAANITNIRFWSIQSAAADYSGSVFWAIYNNAAGQPGSVAQGPATVAVAETPTGFTTGFGYIEYVLNIPVAFSLGVGNYWLGLHNGSLANTSPTEMLWSTTAVGIGSSGLYRDQGSWISTGNEHAFQLDGTLQGPPPPPPPPPGVPEPGTLALFAGGLAAALFGRRNKSGKQATTA